MSISDITEELERHLSSLENDPTNLRLVCDTAELFARTGQFSEARSTIQSAMHTHPDETWLQFRLASIYVKERNFSSAKFILESLMAKGIDNGSIRIMYAKVLIEFSMLLKAEELLMPIATGFLSNDYPQSVVLLNEIKNLRH